MTPGTHILTSPGLMVEDDAYAFQKSFVKQEFVEQFPRIGEY